MQRDDNGFRAKQLVVQFPSSSRCLFRARETDEAEAFRRGVNGVSHDARGCDCPISSEGLAEKLVRDTVVDVFYVQVHAGESVDSVFFGSIQLALNFSEPFTALLRLSNIQLHSCGDRYGWVSSLGGHRGRVGRNDVAVEALHCRNRSFVLSKVDEAKTAALGRLITT